jgi:SPP1 gp7 family putative phage head morphogenesis protein
MALELPDFKLVFGMTPKQVVAYMKSKGFKVSWDWQDFIHEVHDKVFTVAKVTRLDLLQDIHNAILQAIADGESFDTFRLKLRPRLIDAGWWGKKDVVSPTGEIERVQLGSVRRIRTIYEVNRSTARAAADFQFQTDNAESKPWWKYLDVGDNRVRHEHHALSVEPVVYRYDDPIWKTLYPPNGFRCRCRVEAFSAAEVKANGWTFGSSKGRLVLLDRLLSQKTGEVVKVTGIRVPDRVGKVTVVAPDAGWNYNPGRSTYAPDLKGYDPKLAAQFNKLKGKKP